MICRPRGCYKPVIISNDNIQHIFPQDNVPRCLWWLKDASMIKQAFEALCVNELKGLEFECDNKSRFVFVQLFGAIHGSRGADFYSGRCVSDQTCPVASFTSRVLLQQSRGSVSTCFFFWCVVRAISVKVLEPEFETGVEGCASRSLATLFSLSRAVASAISIR